MYFATFLLSALTLALPVDVELDDRAITRGPIAISKFPTSLQNFDLANSLIAVADIELIKAYMLRLTQFPERWYQSESGLAAALWIKDQIDILQPLVSPDVVLSVNLFKHTWKQPSVIARLEAKNTANGAPGDIVITGSHFDTAARGSPQGQSGPNPAADDDASGIAAVHETLRVMIKQKFVPYRPIEFHFYV
jgi:bacterial leucyl aminopeptidase